MLGAEQPRRVLARHSQVLASLAGTLALASALCVRVLRFGRLVVTRPNYLTHRRAPTDNWPRDSVSGRAGQQLACVNQSCHGMPPMTCSSEPRGDSAWEPALDSSNACVSLLVLCILALRTAPSDWCRQVIVCGLGAAACSRHTACLFMSRSDAKDAREARCGRRTRLLSPRPMGGDPRARERPRGRCASGASPAAFIVKEFKARGGASLEGRTVRRTTRAHSAGGGPLPHNGAVHTPLLAAGHLRVRARRPTNGMIGGVHPVYEHV